MNAQTSPPKPSPRAIPIHWALVPVASLIGLLYLVIVHLPAASAASGGSFEGSGHLPLVFAAAIGALIAMWHGWSWKEIQIGIVNTIQVAMGALLILLVIGALMGTWLAAGIVPSFVYWGLDLLSPSFFLPATCAVCSVISLVSGSSWSTAGTIGVALIAVGDAMGVDKAITAGAIISGAYFGDKMSPMSDTTNLAPAMAGAELFTHIRHMLWTTGPAWVISMVAFGFLGLNLKPAATGTTVTEVQAIIAEKFDPGFIHLAVPIVVIALVVRKTPALPSLFVGAGLGGLLAWFHGSTLGDVLTVTMKGYTATTQNPMVDELLTRGGISSMSDTVLLILAAMTFGGVLEHTGMLHTLAAKILGFAKSTGRLVSSTILTSIGVNILAADQYVAVVVPGRMYAPEFKRRGLSPENLSRALEDGGTITSPLVPWNTCGAFMAGTLGVATGAYLPFCFLNLLNPLIGMFYGFTGWTIRHMKEGAENAPETDPAGD